MIYDYICTLDLCLYMVTTDDHERRGHDVHLDVTGLTCHTLSVVSVTDDVLLPVVLDAASACGNVSYASLRHLRLLRLERLRDLLRAHLSLC